MKNISKIMILVSLLIMITGGQVLAKEGNEQASNCCSGKKASVEMCLRASGYRCLNSSCRAYLEQRRKLSKCAYCDSDMYAYECTSCGNWYPICGNGHYNSAVGDVR